MLSPEADQRPPTEGESVTLIGVLHNDGIGPDGEKLQRGPKTKLRPTPSTDVKEIAEFPVNTRVIADRKIGTWYHVVVEGSGRTGYMAVDLVETRLQDPNSKFHRIDADESAFDIIKNHYDVDFQGFKNLRFYANGLVEVNHAIGRNGIYEPSSQEKMRLAREAWKRTGKFIYLDAATKENRQIVVPSREFADSLDVSSGSWVRDIDHKIGGWLEKAAAFIAFPAGLIVGALECVYDTVAGLVEMVWKLIKSVVTGSMLSDLEDLADGLTKLFTDPKTRGAALGALAGWLEDRWNNPSVVKRWYWRGWIIGYIVAEVLLTFFSGGEALMAKAAEKFGALIKLIKATTYGAKVFHAIEEVGVAAKTSKAAVAVRDAAVAVKSSRPVKAVANAAKAVKASAPARAVVKAARVTAKALSDAKKFAMKVLGFPGKLIARITDAGLLALEKMSPKAREMLQRLGKFNRIKLWEVLGCHSPCRFDPVELERKLLKMAENDAKAAAKAEAKATRASKNAAAASKGAADRAEAAKAAAAAAPRSAAKAEAVKEATAKAESARLAAGRAAAAKQAAADARTAKKVAEETHAARKAQALERSKVLGELRRYRIQAAEDTFLDAEQKELAELIRKLENGELSAAETEAEYQALLKRAQARRENFVPAEFTGVTEEITVSKAAGRKMDEIQKAREALIDKRAAIRTAMGKLGVEPDGAAEAVQKLQQERRFAEARKLEALDVSYKRLGNELVKQSEQLGQVAAGEFAAQRGASELYMGKPGTSGTLDAAYYKPGPPKTVYVVEAKGGASQVGTRNIAGTAYQQGTPEYLKWMIENDRAFREAAKRQGLLKMIESGEIEVEYHLVRAPGGQEVLINEFHLKVTR
ncbi:hypothetical protein ACPPVT_01835 [Angustibacter sp. McL0619]|uniref:hypothetical protein n=1 Tax=Angustibacter sp. McL0619 TaxID=3415676 RepID=UPI003CF9CBC3